MVHKWNTTLEKLTPYPTDERGFKVSASVSFEKSHRHYSHLKMIYPLYLVNAEQPESLPLINKSLENWLGMPGALRGYSYTGAASMYAMLGRGDEAHKYLNQLLDNKMKSGHVHPNTQYTEAGPVIETPLSGAASLHDMLLTSWGGKIRVFPGVPEAWKDVSFANLRAEGAFLVSAVRKNGKTQFVKIESLAGEPGKAVWEVGEVELKLKKGESVVLRAKDTASELVVAPVEPQPDRLNVYGLR
jgi:alpha-L-fucosidase 2